MPDELSLSTTVFGRERAGLPFEKMADLIAEAGYRHIEISRHHDLTGRTETVGRAGLRVWSIHGVSGAAAVSPDESLRRRQVDDECRRIEALACFAPAPYVVHYVDRYLDREYGRRFRRSLEEIHAFAARFGLTVAVETAPYKPQENERYPDSAEIAAFVRSFAAPDLRMTIDINHSNLHEALDSVAANCDGLIANVHLSDNHGQREDHLPPGEGIIDLRQTFAQLRLHGYEGPANLEYHAPEPPDAAALRRVRLRTLELLGWNRPSGQGR